MKKTIEDSIQKSLSLQKLLLTSPLIKQIEEVAKVIIHSYQQGGKLLLCGNGGSAADAQHIAAELVGRYKKDRPSMPALALTTNTSSLTSIGNDYGFDALFSRQVEGLVMSKDVLIVISTSGNSKNILLAAEKAKQLNATVVGLTGQTGGKLKEKVDYCINVPTDETPRIQELHILIGHILCDLIENSQTP